MDSRFKAPKEPEYTCISELESNGLLHLLDYMYVSNGIQPTKIINSNESISMLKWIANSQLIPLPTSISYISNKMGFNCSSLFKHGLCYDEDFNILLKIWIDEISANVM